MLTKKEVIEIFKNGTEEEQLEIVYRTHYTANWRHYDEFWTNKYVALDEFRTCILDGYIAEDIIEEKYLKPAKEHHLISDYELDKYNPYHFMQGDAFIRKESELNQPDGRLWAGIDRYTFEIKHTRGRVVYCPEDNRLYGSGVCLDKTHNADYVFLYQMNQEALYVYSIDFEGNANLLFREDLADAEML